MFCIKIIKFRIVGFAPLFVPVALLCVLIALLSGQIFTALIGFILSIVGIFTSPTLLALIGISIGVQ